MEEYINEIAKYLLNNNIVFFIGAGFSREFGYPGWGELLLKIINKFDLKDALKNSTLFTKFKEEEFSNYMEINEDIFKKLKGVDFLRLADYIDYLIVKKEGEKNQNIKSAIIEEINEFETKRTNTNNTRKIREFFDKYKPYLEEIITTNYDTNIEYCFNNEVSVIHRGYDSLNSIDKRNKVYKIHGCITDQHKEIIITERDYQNFLLKNRYLFYKVFSLLTEKKLVFLGYSINDPNIRSLLNEIRYESKDEVNLEVYWVNYDKVDDLDKEYYETIHNIKIIENINIVGFFELLQVRIEKNKDIKSIDRDNISEISEEYRNNFHDKMYINEMLNVRKIINDENKEDILKNLYVNIIDNRDKFSINPFLYLFLTSENNVKNRLKLNIQNILEDKGITIKYIIEYIENDSEGLLDNYMKTSELIDIFINSAIEYCDGHHSFGGYGQAILICLKIVELFKEKYIENKTKILLCLSKNIKKSSKTKWLGYDWNALYTLEKHINILSLDDVIELISLVSSSPNLVRSEQINTIIESYEFDDIQRKRLEYDYLIKDKLMNEVTNKIEDLLDLLPEKKVVKWFEEYNYKYNEESIVFKIDENYDFIEYSISIKDIFKLNQIFNSDNKKCEFIVIKGTENIKYSTDQIDDIIANLKEWLSSNVGSSVFDC